MKSPSLDSLYHRLNKHILLAAAYCEIKELSFIIKACRLKPYELLYNKDYKLILHRCWIDEYGNSLSIDNQKIINIIYNNLEIDQTKLVCTDLYYGLSLNKIIKLSKLAYLYFEEDYCIISLLGIDNYLRTYLYTEDQYKSVSALLLGLNHLIFIKEHIYFKNFLKIKQNSLPCYTGEAWLTYLPATEEFLKIIENKSHFVLSLLGKVS